HVLQFVVPEVLSEARNGAVAIGVLRSDPRDYDRWLFEIARPLGSREDQAHGAVIDQAIVEQTQGIDDPSRARVIVKRDWFFHDGVGMVQGMLAECDRYLSELARG